MADNMQKRMRRGETPPPPTSHETAILRRAARGFVMVTFTEEGPRFLYEDGTPVSLRPDQSGERQFKRMVNHGWLVPDRKDTLFGEAPAQVYRARQL